MPKRSEVKSVSHNSIHSILLLFTRDSRNILHIHELLAQLILSTNSLDPVNWLSTSTYPSPRVQSNGSNHTFILNIITFLSHLSWKSMLPWRSRYTWCTRLPLLALINSICNWNATELLSGKCKFLSQGCIYECPSWIYVRVVVHENSLSFFYLFFLIWKKTPGILHSDSRYVA